MLVSSARIAITGFANRGFSEVSRGTMVGIFVKS